MSKLIADKFKKWEFECNSRFNQLKANEEELNRIFIEIYGLENELTPEIEDKKISVHRAELQREIKSLISYAVGCIFGRYSLDTEGICYAGGIWDESKYKTIIPNHDNIITVCDNEYFDDDLLNKVINFIEVVYGRETLEENLRFIADALQGKETPRETLRSYLFRDFYSEHLKTYQKKPIYWMFTSGKKSGFRALIYMHRYTPDLIEKIRKDYLPKYHRQYKEQIKILKDALSSAKASERVAINKKIKELREKTQELNEFEEKMRVLSDREISIELDDGVKENYAKFQKVLEKI